MQALDFELIICSVQFLDELYLLLFNYDVEQKIDFIQQTGVRMKIKTIYHNINFSIFIILFYIICNFMIK